MICHNSVGSFCTNVVNHGCCKKKYLKMKLAIKDKMLYCQHIKHKMSHVIIHYYFFYLFSLYYFYYFVFTHTQLANCYVHGEASILQKTTLTHHVFLMKINHSDHQPSRPRLQWTFPLKTASVFASVSDSFQFTGDDSVIQSEKRNFVIFRVVWCGRISITTHYNSMHLIINSPRGNTEPRSLPSCQT